ncbi:5-formyltetrahydrofolate cyclo-ligase [Altibacter sp.]|uniref:5-formyltetrahydrofolate cyclo-ligase n=1 Tax=Altibacter sp. TaxID=2024823 RepID=UPI000C8C4A29|nr:5-formyltetrahydrofolate cyclo-ligase [Altibacter sp.]MAP54233.1 5-formyltetrahydrofolate cyclo-ligase [Altibacter sp.]
MSKEELRHRYRLRREALASEEIETLSIAIANNCLTLPVWEKNYFHLFLSITEKKEVNTEYLLHIIQGRDKSVIVSKSDFSSGDMKHFLLQENTPLRISRYGIPEPTEGIELLPQQIEVVFVPLLAFDRQGHRIGYGKGFYDRFLAQCAPQTIFVGLSFFEPEADIVSESMDVPLHYCVTPHHVYSFGKT